MCLSPARFLGALGVLLAVLAVSLVSFAHSNATLRRQTQSSSAAERRLLEQRATRDQLTAQLPDTEERLALERDQQALAAESAVLEQARTDFQRVALDAMRRSSAIATPPPVPSNRASPETTVQSVIRAVVDGEADELAGLIDFDPAARDEAEGFFASLPPELRTQYQSPEKLVAHVMAAKTGILTSTTQSPPVFVGPDDASMRINLQYLSGQTRTSTLHFHRNAGGWKLRVPAKIIEGYRARVTGVVFAPVAAP